MRKNNALLRHRGLCRVGALLLFTVACGHAQAMSTAEVCSYRGRFVESAAHMRDAGKSEAQVLAETKRAFRKQLKSEPPASLNDYIRAVFTGKQYKPAELRQMVEYLCLKEFQ